MKLPSHRPLVLGVVIAAALGTAMTCMAAAQTKTATTAGKYAALDKLPDWTGFWATDNESFGKIRQTTDSPDPNNANVAKLKQKYWDYRMVNKVQNKGVDGKGAYNNAMECIPDGMPSLMSLPIEYEFVMAPNMVIIHSSNGSIRRIYTDGRKPNDDVPASFNGYSIGKWEGDTLVVETTHILNKSEMFVGLRLEGDTRVTERMKLLNKDKFQIETVVYNDTMLNEPFKYSRTYQRIQEMYEALCLENNRDDNATIDLTPPPL
ncbi:MAG: hypothetical protein QM808_13880 [Steroidobacteraceae bacterium]